MKKSYYLLFLINGLCLAQVQNKVGDNPYTIHSSAALEVESSSKGLLLPRMTTLQRDAIATPAEGLSIYNTTTKRIETNLGTTTTPVWGVSGGSVSTWVQTNGYTKNELVVYTDGQIYRSNAAIPANTAWATGTTGATWSVVASAAASPSVTFQTTSTTKPTTPTRSDVLLVTSDGTEAGIIKEVWIYSGSAWVQTQGTLPVSGAVLDNTITDSALSTTVGRYIVPATGLVGAFVGHANQYADWDGTTWTFTSPANNTSIVITTGTNSGQTWKYTTVGGWAQVVAATGIQIFNWALASAWSAGSIVIYQGNLYQANGAIPANTAFTIGTSGATWRAYLLLDDKYSVPSSPALVTSGQSVQTAIANLQGQINNIPVASSVNPAVAKITAIVSTYAFEGSFKFTFYSGLNGTGTNLGSVDINYGANGTYNATVVIPASWKSCKITNNYSWFGTPPSNVQFYNSSNQAILTTPITSISGNASSVLTGNMPQGTYNVSFY